MPTRPCWRADGENREIPDDGREATRSDRSYLSDIEEVGYRDCPQLRIELADMTEYWVSQGNKWCDFCKIFISNNPATIRNHELGQRHKDNVAKRLSDMRKEKAAKDKEEKEATRAMEQIEAKARRSYQKDLASFQEARQSHASALDDKEGSPGKRVTQEEACASAQNSARSMLKEPWKRPLGVSLTGQVTVEDAVRSKGGSAPGPVVTMPLNPMRSVKGAASSVAIGKRKRPDEKLKVVPAEEAAALQAREAARKRMEEREKNLLGLYRH
ncbi:hypothetical protein Nepgr_025386 [Nepenthes gracilis]|uniref:Matrin-type domain-containing protein n=1 Tax=Nepenthes gracilis TaxID=150966 RepID=A0AAD3T663_NEPGR|nr:hypothetical protein Nepgr_025386 [Nepenthes gracilis]